MYRWIKEFWTGRQTLLDDRGEEVVVLGDLPSALYTIKLVEKAQKRAKKKNPGLSTSRKFRTGGPHDQRQGEMIGLLLGGVFIPLSGMIGPLPSIPYLPGFSSVPLSIVMGAVAGISVALIYSRYEARVKRKRRFSGQRTDYESQLIRESIAIFHRCPNCDETLDRTSDIGDGLSQCEECGAAWRIEGYKNDGGTYKPPASNYMLQGRLPFRAPPVTIRDGRGAPVPFDASAPRSKTRFRLLEHTSGLAKPASYRVKRNLGIAAVLVVATSFAVFAYLRAAPQSFGLAVLFFLIVGGFGAYFVDRLLVFERMKLAAASLSSGIVQQGTCPCCSHQLRTTPSPTDGCLICDNCGSAWNQETQQT